MKSLDGKGVEMQQRQLSRERPQITALDLPNQEVLVQPIPHTFADKIKTYLETYRDRLKARRVISGRPQLLEKEEEEIKQKVSEEEREALRHGVVDFSRIQIDDVLAARNSGQPIDFETLSPYLADYNTSRGEIWEERLMPEDEIGLELAGIFRKLFPDGRLISLYDDYNSGLTDSSNNDASPRRGAPTAEGEQLKFSPGVKLNFKKSIINLLKKTEAISTQAQEGQEYLMVSESSKVESAQQLVEQLDAKGLIERDGEQIKFVNDEAENPRFHEIVLRTKNGRWLCEALDASSFLDPENLEITHLVVLPNHFKEQQDKVWGILQELGIKPNNYHNIFYDETADPTLIGLTIQEEFEKISQP